MASYYFDTYAWIEIARANPNYKDYMVGAKALTHKLNLMELAFFLKREGRDNEIAQTFTELVKLHKEASDEAFLKAAGLKFLYRKRKLSYIDCLGYFIAMENGAKFLTGDEKFKDLDGVEFVK